jgi:hypothetical protein
VSMSKGGCSAVGETGRDGALEAIGGAEACG